MRRISSFLKHKFFKSSPQLYPWHFFREIEQSLNLIEDLNQIGFNFLGKIREFIPLKKQILFLYDQDLGKFKVSNFFGYKEEELKNISFTRKAPLVKWLKVNETYLYLKQNPGILNYLTEEEKNILNNLKVELCFPLIAMNRLIGMLLIGAKENGEKFTKQELTLLSSLTPQIGIVLENAVLYKEQRERFRRMSRAERLATVGELAAGAAHEIRNPLTAIKSSLQYLKTKIKDENENRILKNALEETERIDKILSGLLSFAKPSEMKKEKINLLNVLEESLDLISFQARKQKVEIQKNFPFSAIFLKGDKGQLKQLFLNIFLNSLQAMKEEGELKIEVDSVDSRKVLIIVSDTGEGISDENLDRIFDPFFTTKKGGTGLGLSICYGIVKAHDGDIEVKSKIREGTTVILKLPVEDIGT